MAADLVGVTTAVAVSRDERNVAEQIAWPGTPILDLLPLTAAGDLAVLAAAHDGGAEQVVLLSSDAPDLPALLIGKLFRALGHADVAVLPARGRGLVALGLNQPPAAWFLESQIGLDSADAVEHLGRAAPSRRALSVGPGWHRIRSADDLALLDPALEGWAITRRLLRRQTSLRSAEATSTAASSPATTPKR